MSDFDLIRAILGRSWTKAKEIVKQRPNLVFVGAYPRCDYIDLDENDIENEEEASQASGRITRRGALHELCRQCVEGEHNNEEDADADERQNAQDSTENKEIYDLARDIIRASHQCQEYRRSWDHKNGYPSNNSLLTQYVGDQTPLHILFSAQNVDIGLVSILFESVSLRTERELATIQLPTIIQLLTSQSRLKCTPLHYLAENHSCSSKILEQILHLAESMANKEESSEALPLEAAFLGVDDDDETVIHWALESQVSPQHFQTLLKYGGTDAFWYFNVSNELPFDQFARACSEDMLEAAEENFKHLVALLSVIDSTTKQGGDDGKEVDSSALQPLHILASSIFFPCPTYLFEQAIRHHEADLTAFDASPRGLQPLHLALSAPRNHSWKRMITGEGEFKIIIRTRNETNIGYLLDQHPECASLRSREGRAALHYAAESHIGTKTIERLVSIYPGALTAVDPITGLHPVALAAVADNNSLDVVFELCRSCPSALIS